MLRPYIDKRTGWARSSLAIALTTFGNSCSYFIFYCPKEVNQPGTPANGATFRPDWAYKGIENSRLDVKRTAEKVMLSDRGWILVNGHATTLLTRDFPVVHAREYNASPPLYVLAATSPSSEEGTPSTA